MLAVNDDVNVHLMKGESTKDKDKRRQMTSTSIRNLTSHLAAICYSNFRPVPEKWVGPKKLPIGCAQLLKMMKDITRAHFKPLFPAYILNEDCSS